MGEGWEGVMVPAAQRLRNIERATRATAPELQSTTTDV
jgi:hypothetical protein